MGLDLNKCQNLLFILLLGLASTILSCGGEDPQLINGTGTRIHYYQSGEIKARVELKDSVPHGSYQTYHSNGKLEKEGVFVNGNKEGLFKHYDQDGNISLEAYYINGKRDSILTSFYSHGKIKRMISYREGKKHGLAKQFYKDGTLHSEVNYKNNKKAGDYKRYFPNGKLHAISNWKNGYPGLGTKEYNKRGQLLKQDAIEVEEINKVAIDGTYILKLRMSNGTKKVEFFTGDLLDGKYLHENLMPVLTDKNNGTGSVNLYIAPGSFMMSTVNFIAKVRSFYGNYYVVQKTFNIAVTNTR